MAIAVVLFDEIEKLTRSSRAFRLNIFIFSSFESHALPVHSSQGEQAPAVTLFALVYGVVKYTEEDLP